MIRVFHVDEDAMDLIQTNKQLQQGIPDLIHRGFSTCDELLSEIEKGEECDCILSYYGMPKINGLDLLSEIRKTGNDIPFILLIDVVDKSLVKRAFDAGVNDLFIKSEEHIFWPRLVVSIQTQVKSWQRKQEVQKHIKELADQRELLTALIETAPQQISFKDGNNRWLDMNKASSDFWNKPPENFYGKTALEMAEKFPARRESLLQIYEREEATWNHGKTIHEIQEFKLPDGSIKFFDVLNSPIFNEDGGRKHLITITADVTDFMNIEHSLKESESLYRSIFDNSPVGLFIHDEEGTILRLNSRIEEIFGRKAEEMLGRQLLDFAMDETRQQDEEEFNRLLKRGWSNYKSYFADAQGNVKHFDLNDYLILLPDGDKLFLASMRDTTEEMELRRNQEITNELMQNLNNTNSLKEVSNLCLKAALDISRCEIGGFFFKKHGVNQARILSHQGLRQGLVDMMENYSLDIHDIDYLYQGNTIFGSYAETDGSRRDLLPGVNWKALAVLPLGKDKTLGSFFVTSESLDKFPETVEEGLRTIAGQVSNVINNLKIRNDIAHERERFNFALSVAGFNVWDWDITTNTLTYSRVGFSTTSIAEGDGFKVSMEEIEEYIHPDDYPWIQKGLQDHIEGKTEIYKGEYRLKARDGNWRWISGVGRLVEWSDDGEPLRIIGMDKDITEEKKISETLKQTEERLQITMDATDTGIWDWNIQTNEARFNQNWAEMLGYELDELKPFTAETWNSRCHPEDLILNNRLLKDYFEGRLNRFDCELRFKHREGYWVWMQVTGRVVVWDDEDKPKWMVGISRNITESKERELRLAESQKQLKAHANELENLNQQLESFTYTISHDLHAPLRHIKGYANLIKVDLETARTDGVPFYIEQIDEAIIRLEGMIDAVLRLYRTTTGAIELQNVNLSEIANIIARELQNSDPDRKVHFIIEDGLHDTADPDLITVVIQNLFGNSWKFSSKCEDVTISFRKEMIDNTVYYCVSDNGPGFDVDDPGKLFLPFKRLQSVDEFDGTGIGLATVARIIRRHGGEVFAESEPGKGATFKFALAR